MAAQTSRGLVGLLKRGWHEIPEVVGSGAIALVGLGLCITANVIYYKKDGNNRKYRQLYTVYRNDDPRVQTLKTEYEVTSKR